MRYSIVIILLDFILFTHAKELFTHAEESVLSGTTGVPDTPNKLADELMRKMFNRIHQASFVHQAGLDNATFGKHSTMRALPSRGSMPLPATDQYMRNWKRSAMATAAQRSNPWIPGAPFPASQQQLAYMRAAARPASISTVAGAKRLIEDIAPIGKLQKNINTRARSATSAAEDSASWSNLASSATQEQLMDIDMCIAVDNDDKVIGPVSKAGCHKLGASTNKGFVMNQGFALHRAFSVFLFDLEGRLLLQQRAKSKITFAEYWTNTCCSHPLIGKNLDEVDEPNAIESGEVLGIKRAAIRKLGHELGIREDQLPIDDFKFLTRIHYAAPDPYPPDPDMWGEHEIDYVLFIKAAVDLSINPEEIEAVKYVDLSQLKSMMSEEEGLRWTPWFRIIVEKFLPEWWSDLDSTLKADDFLDGEIHRFVMPERQLVNASV